MEAQVKRILSAIYLVSSLWVMVIALAVAAIVYLLKAILVWLTPALGYAGAYLVCSLLCIAPLVALGLYARSKIKPKRTHHHGLGDLGGTAAEKTETVAALVQTHPIEAVLLAFTLGFSFEHSADLRAIVGAASRHARQH